MSIMWVLIGFAAGAGTGVLTTVMYLADTHRRSRHAAILDQRQARRDGYVNDRHENERYAGRLSERSRREER